MGQELGWVMGEAVARVGQGWGRTVMVRQEVSQGNEKEMSRKVGNLQDFLASLTWFPGLRSRFREGTLTTLGSQICGSMWLIPSREHFLVEGREITNLRYPGCHLSSPRN